AGYLVKRLRAAALAARCRDDTPVELAIADHRAGEGVGAARAEGLSILVAEDNEINALLARALLHRLGHRTTIAPNGAAALETFCAAVSAGKPYDLVLMDVHMPDVDGLEATRRMRAAEVAQDFPHTRIIALTANAFGEDREACLAAGMDDFLVKPLDRDRLAQVLAGRAALAA